MKKVKIAAIQMCCSKIREENIAKADKLVREAARSGAQIIILPELFETQYFCQERNYDYYKLATKTEDNPAIKHFSLVAKELKIVLPISFFEKSEFFATSRLISTMMISAIEYA